MKKVIAFINKYRHYLMAFGICVCLILVDQITKHVVKNNVEMGLYPGIEVIRNFFYITYSENTGALNGSFSGKQSLLIVVTIFAILVFIYLAKDVNFTKKRLFSWAVCLIMAGTIGNFIDRLFNNGGVVDFLSFYPFTKGHDWVISWISLDPWPTFNFADSFLVVGVISLAIDLLFFEKDLKEKKDKNTPNVPESDLKNNSVDSPVDTTEDVEESNEEDTNGAS